MSRTLYRHFWIEPIVPGLVAYGHSDVDDPRCGTAPSEAEARARVDRLLAAGCGRCQRRTAEIRSPRHGPLCGRCAVAEVERHAAETGVMDAHAAMGWPEANTRAEAKRGPGIAAFAAAVMLALGVACAPALDAQERAAADEALAAGAALSGATSGVSDRLGSRELAGYVIRAGELVLWTLPAADPGPAPAGAVARYGVATGRVTALRGSR